SQRDEGNIDYAKIDKVRDVLAREKSCVQFFHHHHARLVANFPGQLTVTDIHRVNFRRAALQKAIGETAGRCANVERDLAANIDLEKVQRAFQFERTSA